MKAFKIISRVPWIFFRFRSLFFYSNEHLVFSLYSTDALHYVCFLKSSLIHGSSVWIVRAYQLPIWVWIVVVPGDNVWSG